jgi:hypothetical protein
MFCVLYQCADSHPGLGTAPGILGGHCVGSLPCGRTEHPCSNILVALTCVVGFRLRGLSAQVSLIVIADLAAVETLSEEIGDNMYLTAAGTVVGTLRTNTPAHQLSCRPNAWS